MSYVFSEDQLDEIRDVRDAAMLGTGSWADVYATIFAFLTWPNGDRKHWVEESVWLWIRGAEEINRGTGDYSSFIRTYTEEQLKLRYEASVPQPTLQEMSDEVAKRFSQWVLANATLPSLRSLGEIDASAVASFFDDDFGAWSGNPLFVPLGDDFFYREYILSSANGAYDFGAMIWSSREALQEVDSLLGLFLDVGRTIRDNNSGFFGTFWRGVVLSFDTSDMLTERVGLSLPEFFAHALTVSTLNVGEIVLDTSGDDLLFGGRLDDVFRLTLGYDVVDGGEGEDTVDYTDALGPIEIEIGGHAKARDDVVRVKKDTDDAVDWLYSIETIRGTAGDDTAFLRELSAEGTIPKLDGAGGFDTFSAAGLAATVAITITVAQTWQPLSITTSDSVALDVVGFEHFELGGADDVVVVAGLPDPWDGIPDPLPPPDAPDRLVFDGGLGDDTFTVNVAMGAPRVILLGGDGDDVFEIVGGWDENGSEPWQDPYYRPVVIHGGAGVDTLRITGSTSLIFVQVSDPSLLSQLDLDALGASVATGRGHSGTVVVVNPEAHDIIEWNGKILTGGAPDAVRDVSTQTDTYDHVNFYSYNDPTLNAVVVVGADAYQYDIDVTRYYYVEDSISYGGFIGRGIGQYGDEGQGTFFYATDSDTYDTIIFTNFVNGDMGMTFLEAGGGAMNTHTVRSWTNAWDDPSDTLTYYAGIDGPFTSWWWIGNRYVAVDPIISAWTFQGSDTTTEAAWDPFSPGFGDASLRPSIDHLLAPPPPIDLRAQPDAVLFRASFQTTSASAPAPTVHVGTTGDDLLIGTAGDDVFFGGAGRDGIYGHAGRNRIDGGADDDFFRSGPDEDTFVFREGDGADLIERFDVGMDRISLVGSLMPDDLSFTDTGVDTIIATASGTSFTLLGVTGHAKSEFVFIDDATEAVLPVGPISPIFGTPGDDDLVGGPGRDRLQGFDGDDRLDGGDGDDVLDGGAGADDHVLRPGGGEDVVVGFDATLDRVALDGVLPTSLTLVDDGDDALLQTPHGAGLRFLGGAGLTMTEILFVDATSGLPFTTFASGADSQVGDGLAGPAAADTFVFRPLNDTDAICADHVVFDAVHEAAFALSHDDAETPPSGDEGAVLAWTIGHPVEAFDYAA